MASAADRARAAFLSRADPSDEPQRARPWAERTGRTFRTQPGERPYHTHRYYGYARGRDTVMTRPDRGSCSKHGDGAERLTRIRGLADLLCVLCVNFAFSALKTL